MTDNELKVVREGHGRFVTNNEKYSEFDGEWKNDARNGKGVCFFVNGGYYSGEWQNNKRHGTGTMIKNNGEIYHGQWKDDKKHGKGTLWGQTSIKFVGIF